MRYGLYMILAVCLISQFGCEARRSEAPVLSSEIKEFEVVGINQPKHFYVSFREVGTGFVFKNQYVSKHCNDWRKLKLGSRWKLTVVTYQGKNSPYSELKGVRYEFCDAIRAL